MRRPLVPVCLAAALLGLIQQCVVQRVFETQPKEASR